jgi:predicted NBD/HSP70 family sugar kinase
MVEGLEVAAQRWAVSLKQRGDPLAREIFGAQAQALGLFFDEMINTFDPDAVIVGGGAIETGREFQEWFIVQIRRAMPAH